MRPYVNKENARGRSPKAETREQQELGTRQVETKQAVEGALGCPLVAAPKPSPQQNLLWDGLGRVARRFFAPTTTLGISKATSEVPGTTRHNYVHYIHQPLPQLPQTLSVADDAPFLCFRRLSPAERGGHNDKFKKHPSANLQQVVLVMVTRTANSCRV